MDKATRRITTWRPFILELLGELFIRLVAIVILVAILLFGIPGLLVDGVEASPVYPKAEEMMSPPQYPMGCGQEQPEDHYTSWDGEQTRHYLRI
ncbi:MAG: hypothetical protein E6R03_02815 [Hyphomicrobiaceae bacterium]|nr:MAG: hypothetical protein E6R03_02815 [Hyphomicrobiaceae bacterium]